MLADDCIEFFVGIFVLVFVACKIGAAGFRWPSLFNFSELCNFVKKSERIRSTVLNKLWDKLSGDPHSPKFSASGKLEYMSEDYSQALLSGFRKWACQYCP